MLKGVSLCLSAVMKLQNTEQKASMAAGAGREFYEDGCMKGVNQCLGRVIRHRRDWAAVLLLDVRWAMPVGPAAKLPAWMQVALFALSSSLNHRLSLFVAGSCELKSI